MRSLMILGQMMLATAFTMPGCGREARNRAVPPPPPGPPIGHLAPDIEGTDIDGVPFKLSDYRGKVVLLDFWYSSCRPCRAFFPRERSLVLRYKDRPFALLGVNTDNDRRSAKQCEVKEKVNWRSWFDGEGAIVSNWRVQYFPTVYILDTEGVVRHYFCPVESEVAIEEAVEALVKQAEGQS